MPDADRAAFLGGRLRLFQPADGHRAGTDAVLLGACAPSAGNAADVGAGVGAAGLVALVRSPALTMTSIEIDPAVAELCARNIEENGLGGRARAVCADALQPRARRTGGLADGGFDIVLTNPPFHAPGAVRISPDPRKARAHVAAGGLEAWMKASTALLAPGGLFLMIHRADALPAIFDAAQGRLGALRLLPVHARRGAPAIRILVSGRKGSRAPLALLPPLVLHETDGRFTPTADAIHRGEAGIELAPH
ncbi:MAG: methyltransferase [Hyphomicrobiales bacterium]|nr:methyltransferase [Hyphomicrobiales bacterium]